MNSRTRGTKRASLPVGVDHSIQEDRMTQPTVDQNQPAKTPNRPHIILYGEPKQRDRAVQTLQQSFTLGLYQDALKPPDFFRPGDSKSATEWVAQCALDGKT